VERADNGFEDREGHQAPITLRKGKESKGNHPTLNIQHPTSNDRMLKSKALRDVSLGLGSWMLDVGY